MLLSLALLAATSAAAEPEFNNTVSISLPHLLMAPGEIAWTRRLPGDGAWSAGLGGGRSWLAEDMNEIFSDENYDIYSFRAFGQYRHTIRGDFDRGVHLAGELQLINRHVASSDGPYYTKLYGQVAPLVGARWTAGLLAFELQTGPAFRSGRSVYVNDHAAEDRDIGWVHSPWWATNMNVGVSF